MWRYFGTFLLWLLKQLWRLLWGESEQAIVSIPTQADAAAKKVDNEQPSTSSAAFRRSEPVRLDVAASSAVAAVLRPSFREESSPMGQSPGEFGDDQAVRRRRQRRRPYTSPTVRTYELRSRSTRDSGSSGKSPDATPSSSASPADTQRKHKKE